MLESAMATRSSSSICLFTLCVTPSTTEFAYRATIFICLGFPKRPQRNEMAEWHGNQNSVSRLYTGFQNATERKEARWASRLSLTFVKSSVRASKESNVPTRKSGIWNRKIQKTSPIHLQPLQHVTKTGSSNRIGACGHLLCPANAMTNLVHWSKYELQSPHFPTYWIRSDNSTFRSAMKQNNTWIPARRKKSSKWRPCAYYAILIGHTRSNQLIWSRAEAKDALRSRNSGVLWHRVTCK
jgi:hypothetical protein